MSRRPAPKRSQCGRCGQTCRTRDGICAVCKGLIPNLDELAGGQWVRRGLIYQWTPLPTGPVENAAAKAAVDRTFVTALSARSTTTSRPRTVRQHQMSGASPTERNTTDS